MSAAHKSRTKLLKGKEIGERATVRPVAPFGMFYEIIRGKGKERYTLQGTKFPFYPMLVLRKAV